MKNGEIFNDVLGPGMTGPSSSHTAGPVRIGHIMHDVAGGIRKCAVLMSSSGSYKATLTGQGSNFGFCGGLLGMLPDDDRLKDSMQLAEEAGVSIEFRFEDRTYDHPNRVYLQAEGVDGRSHSVAAKSVGGGAIIVDCIDGLECELDGSKYCLLEENAVGLSETRPDSDSRVIRPVTGVITRFVQQPPFRSAAEMSLYCSQQCRTPLEAITDYESSVAVIEEREIRKKTENVLEAMCRAWRFGAACGGSEGFSYMTPSAAKLRQARENGRFIDLGLLGEATVIAVATMEHNRRSGTIVAAPTAGSSGVLPAVLLPCEEQFGKEKLLDALLISGIIGTFIFNKATFAAESCGCQAENGSASAMAAGALAYMYSGSLDNAFSAASLAMQNMLGLICDPVAGGVEIPCISRNVAAAANAYTAANMIINGFDSVIPLDDAIESMARVGSKMCSEHRCTSMGGLAACRKAREIADEINRGNGQS